MKKTLLCLAIGILSFYVGIFTKSLIYWDKIKLDVSPIEREISVAEIPSDILTDDDYYKYGYPPSPDGAYFPNNEKESDTALILIILDDSNRADVKIGNKIFRSEKSVINEKGVSFKTVKSRQNVEYKFEGNFIKNPFKNEIDDGKVNLVGTLTKIKDGKILYKIKTKYIFAQEVCAWQDVKFEEAN